MSRWGMEGPPEEVFGNFSHALPSSSQRPRDPAVLADPPEVDSHEDDDHEREHEHMEHVPAQQGGGADLCSAQEHEPHLGAEHRAFKQVRNQRKMTSSTAAAGSRPPAATSRRKSAPAFALTAMTRYQ